MNRAGFTLIELITVVVILGILSALALPLYSKISERARRAEAITALGAIRGAQERYWTENNSYAAVFTDSGFDMDDPTPDQTVGYFTYYLVPGSGSPVTVASARRNDNKPWGEPPSNYSLWIRRDGSVVKNGGP